MILALSLLTVIGAAPCCGSGLPQTTNPTYHLDRPSVEVPFEYVGHEILVRGSANGRGDLLLLVDTGASAPVLDSALDVRGEHLADMVFHEAEGITAGESVRLDSFSLGGPDAAATVRNIAAFRADLSQTSRLIGRKLDGIVGITFLAGFVTQLDFEKRVLRFTDARRLPELGATGGHSVYQLRLQEGDPARKVSLALISGTLNDRTACAFLLDTGYAGYVSVPAAIATESGLIGPDTPRAPLTVYSLSRQFQSERIRASRLRIGPIDLSGHVILVDERNNGAAGQPGIVGNRFLQGYRVTLDYGRRLLWLERVATADEPDDAGPPQLGFTVRDDGDALRVERIAAGSPASQAGMRPGDKVVAVNGHDVLQLARESVLNLLRRPPGPVRLNMRRAVDPNLGTIGNPYSVTLVPTAQLDWGADTRGADGYRVRE